jgi:hypothetical protein
MNVFLLSFLWFAVFFVMTRLVSVIGGKYTRYLRSTIHQDVITSMILSILIVFVV